MKRTPKQTKSPIVEGLVFGVVSWLAIDRLSPNYLLVTSWACFLVYLVVRYYLDNHTEKTLILAPVIRICRILGWALIVPLALLSCIGSAQQ